MAGRLLRITVVVIVLLLSLPLAAFATPAPQSTGGRYVVKGGDTLANIAWSLGVSTSALAKANGIKNASRIYPGQVLTLPGQKAADTASVKPAAQDNAASKPAAQNSTVSKPVAQSSATSKPASAGKWIDVDLTKQQLTAYKGNTSVFSTLVSTGIKGHPTPVGEFAIRFKMRWDDMAGPGYYLADVPFVMYFADYIAIHGTYWHHNFGHPMSHGCVNLSIQDSAWIYAWAPVGTPVVVHW